MLARPWLMADVSRLRPGSFRSWSWSDASRCAPGICPPGGVLSCAPGRLPWFMLDALQVAPWCSFRPWLMADASRLRPGSLRSWSWLMSPGGRPGARSVPGLCSMRSRCAPGSLRSWLMADALQNTQKNGSQSLRTAFLNHFLEF